jgi:DNA polymerase-3 subunit gamma/tau
MSYQVIARKWRPQKFDQLIGQSHISQTLINALRNGRIPHALLFTGPRGTGKTSSARILAKSLRCSELKDFVPCGVCNDCTDIASGRSVDVMEIDGASNNGVDAIRELRETVSYSPSSGKYKVYIIDEVHMLSTSAFNALLKTLEEPPEHVVFIMATTEVHKIPQTILSRCQRFDFRSIPTRQISDALTQICEKEGVGADPEGLWVIARQGEGSMRDSQSLLDQVITFANGPLTRANVVQILGLTDRALLLETLTSLAQRSSSAVISLIEKVRISGIDPGLFAKELLEVIRNLLITKISAKPAEFLDLPESEIRFLQSLAVDLSESDIHLLFDMALKGAADIPRAGDPNVVLEMVLLRISQAPKIVDLAQLMNGALPAPALTTAKPQSSTVSAPMGVSKHKVDPVGLSPQEKWFEFVNKLKLSEALLAAKIESLSFLGEKNKTLELAIPTKFSFLKDQLADSSVKVHLQKAIESHFGQGYGFLIQNGKDEKMGTSAKEMAVKQQQQKDESIAKQVAEHPLIKTAQTALKGQIKSIKST